MINELCDELFDEFIEQHIFPSGFPEDDYQLYKRFHSPEFEKYPGLESCFAKKVGERIVDVLVNWWYEEEGFDIEEFENKQIIKDYFRVFKNLNLKENFENTLDPESSDSDSDSDGGDHNKYKRFLDREPASHLKMLLKQAEYKGFAKMNKKELVALILSEIKK